MEQLDLDEKLENGEPRYKVMKSGAIYDHRTKRICAKPRGGPFEITKENAAAMAQRRNDLRAEAAVKGFIEGTPGINPKKVSLAALEKFVEHATAVYHKTEQARGLAELGNFVMKQTELGAPEPDKEPEVVRHEYAASPELVDLIRDLRKRQQETGVVEGEVTCVRPDTHYGVPRGEKPKGE